MILHTVMLGNERVVYREGKHKIGQWVLIAFPSSTHPFIKYFISDESDLAQVLSLHYKPLIVVIK